MAVHVTRCPHCQTSFRIRDEHLNAARGMVRCGSCLQVFKAAEHFLPENKPASAEKPSVASPKVAAAQAPTSSVKLAQPQPIASSAHPAKAENTAAPKIPAKTVETASTASAKDNERIHDNMDDDDNTFLSDDPFTDFNIRAPESRPRPAPRIDDDFDESFLSLENVNPNSLSFVDPNKISKNFDDEDDWANSLLDDDDDIAPAKSKPATSRKTLDEFVYDRPPAEEDDFRGFFDDEDHPQKSNSKYRLGADDVTKHAFEIAVPQKRMAQLQDEPLQFSNPAAQKQRLQWGWISGIVVMALIAIGQTLYFNFDNWGRSPQWRPMYAQICAVLECQLPKIQNINTMTTQHLVIRAHPNLQRALMVDTLLLNKADYEQPFPDLLLVFRDLNDRVVASRRFAPAQYLSGELAGQLDMPVRTPVHLALEIADPGPEAVSYAISLLSNQ